MPRENVAEKAVVSEAKVVDISDFFTKERKEEGVWHEAEIEGSKIGIMFKVIGSDSDAAASIFSDYDKSLLRINSLEDSVVKSKEMRELISKTGSKLVKDIKAAEGVDAKIDGKPLTYSDVTVYRIFFNAPSIANDIINFARRDGNFMEKKAN